MIKTTLFRSLSLFLVLVFLVGCTGSTQPPSSLPPDGAPEAVPSATRLPTWPVTTPPAAAEVTPAASPYPTLHEPLVWVFRSPSQRDLPLVNEELNRRLDEQGFNARIELRLIEDSGQWSVTGDGYDLATISGAQYTPGVEQGAFLPLTAFVDPQTNRPVHLLEAEAPDLWSVVAPPVWESLQVEGEIYALPAQGAWVQPVGLALRADVVEALDLSAEVEALDHPEDLTDLFERLRMAIADGTLQSDARVRDGSRVRTVLGQVDLLRPELGGYDPLAAHFALRADNPLGEVVNWYLTSEFQQLAELRRAWRLAGYTPATAPDPESQMESCQAGRFVAEVGRLGNPGRCGYTWIERPLAPLWITTAGVQRHLTVISAATAADSERARYALRLLNRLYSDPQLFNLLAYGIEGRHWAWVDPEQRLIRRIPGSGYQPNLRDSLGAEFLAYATNPLEAAAWENARRWQLLAQPSAALGFRFDTRPVAPQLAALHGLHLELIAPLNTGQVKEVAPAVRRLDEQCRAAGAEAVEIELREQFDRWRSYGR